jgi:hypothetical protein
MLLTWRDGWRGAQELLDLIGHFDAHLPGQLPLFPIPERAMCSVVMGGYTSCAAPTNTTDLAVLGRDRSGSRPGDRRLRALGTVLGDSANGTEVDDGWLTIGCGCLVAALLLLPTCDARQASLYEGRSCRPPCWSPGSPSRTSTTSTRPQRASSPRVPCRSAGDSCSPRRERSRRSRSGWAR